MSEHFWWALDGHKAVPSTQDESLALFSDTAARTVAKTYIGEVCVSTVFLCIDHGAPYGDRPILFETLVFDGLTDGGHDMRRYETWEQAEAGHAAMVERVRKEAEGQRKESE